MFDVILFESTITTLMHTIDCIVVVVNPKKQFYPLITANTKEIAGKCNNQYHVIL